MHQIISEVAAKNGHIEIVKFLIGCTDNPKICNGYRYLLYKINSDIVETLLNVVEILLLN